MTFRRLDIISYLITAVKVQHNRLKDAQDSHSDEDWTEDAETFVVLGTHNSDSQFSNCTQSEDDYLPLLSVKMSFVRIVTRHGSLIELFN